VSSADACAFFPSCHCFLQASHSFFSVFCSTTEEVGDHKMLQELEQAALAAGIAEADGLLENSNKVGALPA